MTTYKNVILDVGEVLFDYRWQAMLTDDYGLSGEQVKDLNERVINDTMWRELDLGTKPFEELLEEYKNNFPEYADVLTWFIDNAEKMKIDRPAVWDKVMKLKEVGYNLYLLSNYSEELLNIHLQGTPFLKDVDGMVVSGKYHVAKPDKEIYEILFREYSLKPEECIFLDDREENVLAGKKAGMGGFVVTDQEKLIEFMDELIKQKHIN